MIAFILYEKTKCVTRKNRSASKNLSFTTYSANFVTKYDESLSRNLETSVVQIVQVMFIRPYTVFVGFANMTRQLMDVADGQIVLALEGG